MAEQPGLRLEPLDGGQKVRAIGRIEFLAPLGDQAGMRAMVGHDHGPAREGRGQPLLQPGAVIGVDKGGVGGPDPPVAGGGVADVR